MSGKRRYSLHENSVKKCAKCGKFKNISEYTWANKKMGWKQSYCRECVSTKQKRKYAEFKRKINDYLLAHSCVDCGNSNPAVMDFDHVRGEKKFLISQGWFKPWAVVMEEIAKCDVRCKNCHVMRHDLAGWGGGRPISVETDEAGNVFNGAVQLDLFTGDL